jgi:hypothetical protein
MDEFYDDEEVDQFTQEFTDGVKKGIKKTFLEKMERLELEITELRAVKRDMAAFKRNLESEIRDAKRELELEKKAVRDASLAELMRLIEFPAYTIDYSMKTLPKCGLCDAERKVVFTSPDGRTRKGPCSCDWQFKEFHPKPVEVVEIKSKSGPYEKGQNIIFIDTASKGEGERGIASFARNDAVFVSGPDEYQAIDDYYYRKLFRTIENAQAYCDHRNAIERAKEPL